MKQRDRLTSLFWAGVGLYIAYEGYQLKLGTLGSPNCGFFIFWTGVVLTGLSLLLFFQTLLRPKEVEDRQGLWEGARWSKGAKMMVALLLYAFVFRWLGFILSTFLLLLFLLKGLEPQKWHVAIALAVATTAVCYVVFGVFLELQFPPGILRNFFE
jgi:putative tricarboxylic transport membrane protein